MTTPSSDSKSRSDAAVPASDSMARLSEREKQALEQNDHAEHQIGPAREHSQRAAADKAARR